jgi:hypothetical protein
MRVMKLVFLFSLIHLCGSTVLANAHTSDEELIKNFKENRATFEKLISMIQSEKYFKRVDDDWTNPPSTFSVGAIRERVDSYRKMFKQLKIPRGFSAYIPNTIDLIATAGVGPCKGYTYMTKKPALVVDNLDLYRSPDGGSFVAYRHISGNWYLFED